MRISRLPPLAAIGLVAAMMLPPNIAQASNVDNFVHVKFAEGTAVRLRGGQLVSLANTDLSASYGILRRGSVSRLFADSESTLASYRQGPDLNQWYRVGFPAGINATSMADALNRLGVIETAYVEPQAAPPPIAPDYQSLQGYRRAGTGIDADYARTVAGGTGANVRVHDIEFGWTTGHEDLSKLRAAGALVANGTPRYSYPDHGTAVVGELSGDDNGGGVLGLVPDARIQYTNATNAERGYDPANAITKALTVLRAGDVMLLEQQVNGPSGCSGYVPVEWVPAVYDAIVTATSAGVIVVEAAGNGSMNLDSSCFGTRFPRGKADSGAIIVGAGGAGGSCSTARARKSFSTYGSRVDLQGWGECVASAGYGDLYGSSANTYYTNRFSGTSSASPIVAGAAAALSSVAKQRGLSMTPQEIRSLLKGTGAPQVNPSTGNIGPLPNLQAAINNLPGSGQPNFAVSVSPTAGAVNPGGSLTAAVSTQTTSGNPQSVALSATGLPSGATAGFNPASVVSGATSTLTIATTTAVAPGTYSVTIVGTGTVTRTATFTLTVNGASACTGYEANFTGTLSAGGEAIHPNGSYFYTGASGPHNACLDGPAGTDFDLYLQKWNGSAWTNVASGVTSGPDETLSYSGTAGYYRYRVHAYSGSGAYAIGYNAP